MPTRTLTTRQLNRATLARQMLLARERVTPLRAIERLAGLQAQLPRPPYVGLWSRLVDFRRAALTRLLQRRKVVRAPMMRCTLHLVSAKDYVSLRPAIQPALTRSMHSALRKRADGLDIENLVAAAREYLDRDPRTFVELRAHLSGLHRKGDERAMGYAVRTHLPLVQVPTDTVWGYPGTADFAPAESWLDTTLDLGDTPPHALVRRYLAAFGPASVGDAQTWSGLSALRVVFDELRPRLRTFRDERGRELFDLPKAPRPPASARAPARFLPDFDNLVLAHDDRTRLVDDEHRSSICLPNLRVLPTFLVEGRAAGTWKVERAKGGAQLVVEPFEPLARKARTELTEEGHALLRFIEEGAKSFEVVLR